MSQEENGFENLPNEGNRNAAENMGEVPAGNAGVPANNSGSPANNSPSLGEKLGEAAAKPVAAASNSNTNASNSPANMAAAVAAPPSNAPPTAAPPATNKPKKTMTLGQKQLQEERAKTLKMMRNAYAEVFGDDKKAPKAKAYEAAGLTTIRLKEGDEAFRTKLYDEYIPRNQGKYMNKGTTAKGATKKVNSKTKKGKTVTFKAASPVMNALPNSMAAMVTKGPSPTASSTAGSKVEEYLNKSYSSAVKAVKHAKNEALEVAAKNLRAVAPRPVADKLVQIMHSEGGAATNTRLFSEICELCAKRSPAANSASNTGSTFNASRFNLSRRANSVMPLNNSASKKKSKTKRSASKKRSASPKKA